MDPTSFTIENRTSSNQEQVPYDLTVQYSDNGSTWTDFYQYFGLPWTNTLSEVITLDSAHSAPLNNAIGISWRILITADSAGQDTSLAKLQFFDDTGTMIPTTQYAAITSSSFGNGELGFNAFDGNAATDWASAAVPSGGSPQWVGFRFASSLVSPATFSITARAGIPTQSPSAFSLQYSTDEVTWTTRQTYAPAAWTTGGQVQTFASSATTTQTQPGTARAGATLAKTLSALARVASGASRTLSGVARVQESVSRTQGAVARVAQVAAQDESALARIEVAGNPTLSAVARIQEPATRDRTAVARVAESVLRTRSALARVQESAARTRTALARVAADVAQDQPAVANIFYALSERGGIDYDQIRGPARHGPGSQFQMHGGGATQSGHAAVYGSTGNTGDAGSPPALVVAAPASHSDTGAPGQVAYDGSGNYYWCYAADSWARVGPGGWSNSF